MPASKTILVVEDELSVSKVLKDKLSRAGFRMLTAANGAEGLRSALRHHPDLILLDIIMPVMDGMTMLKKLRQDKWGKKAEIIILTNLSDTKDVADALRAGAYDYLVKANWSLESLVRRVKDRLGV
ncbi:response regulator [Patescibacteria group bacterium]|nr:MAG: response regulator [Patescibacteria group bacterium]